MPETDWGFEILPSEFESWIQAENADWICVDKPALVVCHPSKHGPASSLVGACRLYRNLEACHLVFRIDRETSGVVLIARNREAASRLQKAVENRKVHKEYIAILKGELRGKVLEDRPLGRHRESVIVARQGWRPDIGRPCATFFEPIAVSAGFSFVRVTMSSGRQHQIRAHAELLGHPVVGDKIYGMPDEVFLSFIGPGLDVEQQDRVGHRRHALHAWRVVFDLPEGPLALEAPLAPDLVSFCRERMGMNPPGELIGRAGPA